MGWLDRLEAKAAFAPADFWPHEWPTPPGGEGRDAPSGERVSAETVISSTAVWAALQLVAGTVATLPVGLFRRRAARREPVDDHPSLLPLRVRANRWMPATSMIEAMQGRIMFRGNGYAQILRTRGGEPAEIVPLNPDRVRVRTEKSGLVYVYADPTEGDRELPGSDVLHVRGFSANGVVGLDPIATLRGSFAVGLAAEKHGARFFGNAARVSGFVRTDKALGPQAKQNIAEGLRKVGGGENAHKIAILDEGMTWQQVGLSAEDAQLLETRKFQILEVARAFNVPPHLLKDLERATFSNIQEQSLEFEKHTIRPWLTRWEQALALALLTDAERADGYFYRFNVDGLLRGAIGDRFQAYQIAWGNGWMTSNEIRAKEDLDPADHPDADETYVPLNMVPRSSAADLDAEAGGFGAAARRVDVETKERREERILRLRRRSRNLLGAQVARVARPLVNAEIRDIRRALGETAGAGEFLLWARSRFRDVRNDATSALRPVLEDYGTAAIALVEAEVGPPPRPIEGDLELLAREYAETAGARWEAHTVGRLEKLVEATGDGYADRVAEEMDAWAETRTDKIALLESVRADGALVRLAYTLVGVTFLRWAASGSACPICRKMHGRRVGIADAFLGSGQTFNAEGASAPLRAEHDVRHPPLHGGCTCIVLAG